MSAMAAPAAVSTEPGLTQLWAALRKWLRTNIPAAVVAAVIGTIVGFISNVWLIAVYYQGTNGAGAAGHNLVTGSLISGIASTVVFGVYGYYRAVGGQRFVRDLRGLPGTLLSLFTRDGAAGRIHLLWGASVSLIASTVISPGLGAVLAVGLLATLPGIIGRVLSTVAVRAWSQVLQKVAPTQRHRPPGATAMTVGIIGGSIAMLVGFLMPAGYNVAGVPMNLAVAVVCGALAFVLGRQGGAGPAVGMLVALGGAVFLADLLHPLLAHATDGGYAECGYDWGKYLTICQGHEGVVATATAGAVASGGGAAAGLGLGAVAGSGGGSGGDDLGGPRDRLQMPPPPPPPPHFPHVFVRGGALVIECANGVTLTGPLRPDGTVGAWSASNANTQSGGAIENRYTNPDGTTTTTYADGSKVTTLPGGGMDTTAGDGTRTITGEDGTATTYHSDSVDVRSPDGTIITTSRDGTQVAQYPDGTRVETNTDGTTVTQNPDSSVDVKGLGGLTQHKGADGIITADDGKGNTVTRLTDGTQITQNADGSSSTHWPDGSWESTSADGTKTIHDKHGDTFVHDGDGGVVTYNADGSRETRMADGRVSVRDPFGAVTTWNTDGSVGTTHPNGMVVNYDSHGNLTVSLPGGKEVGDPNAVLHNLDEQSGYLRGRPDAYQAVASLQQQLAANGGVWTPALIANLVQLQSGLGQISDRQDAAIDAQSKAFADFGMQALENRLNNQKKMEEYQAKIQAEIDRQQEYIRNHLSDLPSSQWQGVESTLHMINSSSPNARDLNFLSRISHAMFIENQGIDRSGRQLKEALDATWQNPAPPAPPMPTDLRSLVFEQQKFLINHMDDLPTAQRELLQNLVNRDYSNPTLQDLTALQRASHAAFNGVSSASELENVQATVDALDAQGRLVSVQRVNALAQGTGLALALPVMAGGVIAAAGGGLAAAGVGEAAFASRFIAGLGTIAQATTVPGAAAAMSASGAYTFGLNALAGGISGYNGDEYGGGAKGAIWGVAKATLPVNTAAAIMGGEGAGSIAMAMFQDHGNFTGALGFAEHVGNAANEGYNALFPEPKPMTEADFRQLADKTEGMRRSADLADATLRAYDDPNFMKAKQNVEYAQDRLDLFGKNRDPDIRAQLKDDLANAKAILNDNPSQQQVKLATLDLIDHYQGRVAIKNAGPGLQQAYVDQVNLINDEVRSRALDAANQAGITRGGQPLTEQDLVFLRNRTSTTAPMDNDIALNEMRQRELESHIKTLDPTSDQAQRLTEQLQNMQARNQVEIGGKPVSNEEWNTAMQGIWDESFHNVTGRDPHMAMQEVTQRYHGEAYPDLNVLQNDPANHPFDPRHAEATGDVTSYKARQQEKLFILDQEKAGLEPQPWNAQQEIARGTAKDIETKLLPVLDANGGDPGKMAEIKDMQDFLKDVGRGRYGYSEAEALSQRMFGTDINGLNSRASNALVVATKWHDPGPGLADQLGSGIKAGRKLVAAEIKIEKIASGLAASDTTGERTTGQY